MARRKAGRKTESRRKPKKRSGFWRWVLRLLSLAIIVGLLAWGIPRIIPWAIDVGVNIWETLGWGLLLIILAIAAIAGTVGWGRPSLIFRYFHKTLGAIVFFFVVWGILALFQGEGILSDASVGGNFGLGIIGHDQNPLGVLRIIGLVVLGIILVAPGFSFRTVSRFVLWVAGRLKKQPAPAVPAQKAKFPLAGILKLPRTQPEKTVAQKAEAEKEPAPAPSSDRTPQELKQVAQEVWRKYGESPAAVVDGWRLPAIEILDKTPEVEFSQADNARRAKLIEDALASYNVDVKVVQINVGPTVTQFGVEPGWDRKMREVREKDKDGNVKTKQEEVSKTRVKVERITSLSNDLALALAAPTIRIEAPVPGKSIVGVEVPNTVWSVVSLRSVVETNSFQKMKGRSKLTLALGKGAGGESVAGDLTKMPHLLIAGATGSGKTVCLNSTICCLLLHNTPYDIRFIMIDPKRVELTPFDSIPHMAAPVVVETNKALGTLRWLSQEMDKRYQILANAKVRNIEGYNKSKQGPDKLPYLILVIDELADLMMTAGDEVEHMLCRLAQLARATGIHLIVATQRPSVDVVTGLIKANFPTRISFAVTSQVDSRTILDIAGAEKLLGRGDMLYMPTEAAKPTRLQGCFVSDTEAERLVYFWNSQKPEGMESLKIGELVAPVATAQREGFPEDPLLEAARQLATEHKQISASFLQRRLRIGYPRAARLMEQLVQEGVKEDKSEPAV